MDSVATDLCAGLVIIAFCVIGIIITRLPKKPDVYKTKK